MADVEGDGGGGRLEGAGSTNFASVVDMRPPPPAAAAAVDGDVVVVAVAFVTVSVGHASVAGTTKFPGTARAETKKGVEGTIEWAVPVGDVDTLPQRPRGAVVLPCDAGAVATVAVDAERACAD